jgi:hypothetical protein
MLRGRLDHPLVHLFPVDLKQLLGRKFSEAIFPVFGVPIGILHPSGFQGSANYRKSILRRSDGDLVDQHRHHGHPLFRYDISP